MAVGGVVTRPVVVRLAVGLRVRVGGEQRPCPATPPRCVRVFFLVVAGRRRIDTATDGPVAMATETPRVKTESGRLTVSQLVVMRTSCAVMGEHLLLYLVMMVKATSIGRRQAGRRPTGVERPQLTVGLAERRQTIN